MDQVLPSRTVPVRRAELLAFGLALASGTLASPLLAQEAASAAASGNAASGNVAPAQSTPATAVERSAELFRQGRELLARGRLLEACQKFDATLELHRSPGTLLNIGYCRAQGSALLAALEAYRGAIELARAEPDREKARLWTLAAQKEIDALEPRVAELTVRVSHEDVAVQIDERPVNVQAGAILLNPGAHHVRASATGKRTLDLGIELSDGQRLTLTVPPLGDDPSPASRADGAAAPAVVAPAVVKPAGPTSAAPSDVSHRSGWQWPLLIGGGAVFATGAVFGVLAAKMVSQPDFGSASESDRARALALTADVLMGTGVASIGLGVAWPWLDPDPPRANPSPSDPKLTGLSGGCGGSRCGLLLSGAF